MLNSKSIIFTLILLILFPNRSLLLRVLMETQRKEKKGKETESVAGHGFPRPRPRKSLSIPFKIPLRFLLRFL